MQAFFRHALHTPLGFIILYKHPSKLLHGVMKLSRQYICIQLILSKLGMFHQLLLNGTHAFLTRFYFLKIRVAFKLYFNFSIRPGIYFEKPSAEEIFCIILIDALKYEKIKLLKSAKGIKVYTVCNHSLENIISDDNGVHASYNQNKRNFNAENLA